jgi:hypothetical protein
MDAAFVKEELSLKSREKRTISLKARLRFR